MNLLPSGYSSGSAFFLSSFDRNNALYSSQDQWQKHTRLDYNKASSGCVSFSILRASNYSTMIRKWESPGDEIGDSHWALMGGNLLFCLKLC